MTKALGLLQQAREHMLAMKTDKATKYLEKFESLVVAGEVSKEAASECAEVLRSIRMLAEAMRDGLSAAQRQLDEITVLSRNLDTYDRQGQKVDCQVGKGRNQRF